MKLRIAIWACAGGLAVVCWTLYFSAATPTPSGVAWILACLTCPIALAGSHVLSFGFVLLVNAATYAMIGTAVEIMLRHLKTHRRRLASN